MSKRSFEQIIESAANSSRRYGNNIAMKNDHYNTSFMLSHEQVHLAAIIEISRNLGIDYQEAANQYYIDGLSVQNLGERLTMDKLNTFFEGTIEEAVNNSAHGKPSFLVIDNAKHFVVLAFIKDEESKLSICYVNSASEIENIKNVGKRFTELVAQKYNTEALDFSINQQYENCCGLSCASNIGVIVKHIKDGEHIEKIPENFIKGDQDVLRNHYRRMGEELLSVIKAQELTKSLNEPRPNHRNRDHIDKEDRRHKHGKDHKKKSGFWRSLLCISKKNAGDDSDRSKW